MMYDILTLCIVSDIAATATDMYTFNILLFIYTAIFAGNLDFTRRSGTKGRPKLANPQLPCSMLRASPFSNVMFILGYPVIFPYNAVKEILHCCASYMYSIIYVIPACSLQCKPHTLILGNHQSAQYRFSIDNFGPK